METKQDAKIIVSGNGKIEARNIAVGYQARVQEMVGAAGAKLDNKGLVEVHAKLDALIAALNEHGRALADPKSAFELAERVANEMGREKPDKLSLKGWLAAIADDAKSVIEIATAAISLKDLVVALF